MSARSGFPAEITQNILDQAVKGLTPRHTHEQLLKFCRVNKNLFHQVVGLEVTNKAIRTEHLEAKYLINTAFRGKHSIEEQRQVISTLGDRLKDFNHIELDLDGSGSKAQSSNRAAGEVVRKRGFKDLAPVYRPRAYHRKSTSK